MSPETPPPLDLTVHQASKVLEIEFANGVAAMAASGGYYLASTGKRIIAEPTTNVGSIVETYAAGQPVALAALRILEIETRAEGLGRAGEDHHAHIVRGHLVKGTETEGGFGMDPPSGTLLLLGLGLVWASRAKLA